MAATYGHSHYGADGCEGCLKSHNDSGDIEELNWTHLQLLNATTIDFIAFKLNFSQSPLCHTGIRLDVTRPNGEKHSFVYEVSGGRHKGIKSVVRLRLLQIGADELTCDDKLRFFSVAYRHNLHYTRVSALFNSDFEYNALTNNCRDHALGFVRRMEAQKFDIDASIHDWINAVKRSDAVKVTAIATGAVISLGAIIWGIASIASALKSVSIPSDDEEESAA